jgi:hypothetical protein
LFKGVTASSRFARPFGLRYLCLSSLYGSSGLVAVCSAFGLRYSGLGSFRFINRKV